MNKKLISETLNTHIHNIDIEEFNDEALHHIISFMERIYKNSNEIENKKIDSLNFESLVTLAEDIINKKKETDHDDQKDT